MRILQLAKYYPPAPGGIESFVGDLSHALVAQGHDNLVLAHRFDRAEPEELTGPMGRVLRVPSYGELLYAPIAPAYPVHLRRCIQEFRPDMLLVHMPNVSVFWSLFLHVPCPIVVFWHADVVFPKKKQIHCLAYKGYAQFERILLKRAKKIVATSPPYLEHSETLRPFHEKCTVIPLAIDPGRLPRISDEEVSTTKARILGDSRHKYVYAAGRFAYYKGFDLLIRAAALTRTTHPELKFVIAGSGEKLSEMRQLVKEDGLSDHVFLPGRISDHDYWSLMQGCAMFCLPSIDRSEAFGIVLLEAMAMDKPCISTDIPGSGTSWINKDGMVVKRDDPDALARAIRTLSDTQGAPCTRRSFSPSINETASALVKLAE